MEDVLLMELVERYIRGEMKPDERVNFEMLRKNNPQVDQLVVEHTLFIHKMNEIAELKQFKSRLSEIHTDLAEKGKINSPKLKGKAKVVYLWKRYKRVTAIAASIAGITTLLISSLVFFLSPNNDPRKLEGLSRDIEKVKNEQRAQKAVVNDIQNNIRNQNDPAISFTSGGTGFIIDGNGYLVTNYHVVKNAKNIAVQNKKGETFFAKVVHHDVQRDLSILKIDDGEFKPFRYVPYGIRRSTIDIAEPVFTLGYPRDEIVYGQGYLSAKTGFGGDTLSCQIAIAANPGNSGGPVLNKHGEVIGILSTRQKSADGVIFALQSKYIYQAITDLKNKEGHSHKEPIRISASTSLKGVDRVKQVKKIEDYIFMVKVN